MLLQAKNERLQEEQDRADYLDAENRDLVQRIIELKDSEAEKMNKMNEMAQDIVSFACGYFSTAVGLSTVLHISKPLLDDEAL